MKNRKVAIIGTSMALMAFCGLSNVSGKIDEPGLKITPPSSGNANLIWKGANGNTYFVRYSSDLKNWKYLPVIKSGNGSTLNHEVSVSLGGMFFSLQYTDIPTADPATADFDQDGVNNLDEVTRGTNPLNPDSDGDGISDGGIIHVALEGSVSPTPTFSFTEARDLIRKARQSNPDNLNRKYTVIVAPGIYRFTESFQLEAQDANTIWKAEAPNTVFITGGPRFAATAATPLTAAEKTRIITPAAADHILRLNLRQANIDIDNLDLGKINRRGFANPTLPLQSELFIDDTPLTLARWPNAGQQNILIGHIYDAGSAPRYGDDSNRGARFGFSPDRIKRWATAKDPWISGYFAHGYADDSVQIESIDTQNKIIKTVQPHYYGFKTGASFRAFYGFNMLEEIDTPGEYYIDHENKMLYFYPPAGFNVKTSALSLSALRTPLINIKDAHHVKFQNFTFQNTGDSGFLMHDTQFVNFDHCTFRNIGVVAGSISGTKNRLTSFKNSVTRCDVQQMGCGGFRIGGGIFKPYTDESGQTVEMAHSKNLIENCYIQRINRVEKTYRSAVNTTGFGQVVRHNHVENLPGTAIYFHGSDHIFEYNKFINCLYHVDDQGVFYYGRNPTELGNTIRYNYFQDCARGPNASNAAVIYADDGALNLITHGNIFVRSGSGYVYLIGGGSYHNNYNNLFINCANVVRVGNRLQTWAKHLLNPGGSFEAQVSYRNFPSFHSKYPFIKNFLKNDPSRPQANYFVGNYLYGSSISPNSYFSSFHTHQASSLAGFASPATNNWKFTPSATARQQLGVYFKVPPFEKMGIEP